MQRRIHRRGMAGFLIPLFAALVAALSACDGSQPVDAAFTALKPGTAKRVTSRIGPQPWPGDLPAGFPRPEGARLLADMRRDGDRLLLVDLPTQVDRAADQLDRALREGGYDVDRAETRRVRHALLARHEAGAAVLSFLARDGQTRLEILFLDRAEG